MVSSRQLTAAATVLLVSLAGVVAVPAPYGAYLGCFDPNSVEMRSDMQPVQATTSSRSTLQQCAKDCATKGYSLTVISPDFKCRCGLSTPPAAAKLPNSQCATGGPGTAVFYAHSGAESTLCRIVELPLQAGRVKIAYNPQNAKLSSAATPGPMQLKLVGPEGTRVETKGINSLYGQYSVRAQISCGEGVISSFYLRSSDEYADLNNKAASEAAASFTELDFEFLSFKGKPCSVWLNTFKNGQTKGEVQFGQPDYQQLLGWPASKSTASWATYTINWQPSYVTWAIDGKPLKTLRQGDSTTYWGDRRTTYESPNLPMHPVFTMWTDSRPVDPFGGQLDASKGPYTTSFADLRQIVCDKAATADAMGPAWLYQ